MNIMPIELVASESLPSANKANTEGTDVFSILMASIAAGNGIPQSAGNVTADGLAGIAGQPAFSAPNEKVVWQGKGLSTAVAAPYTGAGESAAKGVQIPVLQGKEYAGVAPVSDVNVTAGNGFSNEPGGQSQSADSFQSLVLNEPEMESLQITSLITQKTVMGGKVANEHPPATKADLQEKVPAVEIARVSPETLYTEPETASTVQLLLPHAVKGVKAGEGATIGQADAKAGIVPDDGEDRTVNNLDIDAGVVAASVVKSDVLHTVAKTVMAGEKASAVVTNHQVDPADLISQVSGRIRADYKGEGGEVRMELHPESLGHLTIEVKVDGGVVKASIMAENAIVKDAINSNLSVLRSSLEEHGLRIDQLSVGVDQHSGGNAFAERNDLQRWQRVESRDLPHYEGQEPLKESWYRTDSQQEEGVSIFA